MIDRFKFRAWNEKHGDMVYSGNEIIYEKREFYPFPFHVGFSSYPERDWVFMQFTGTQDKKGMDIYEDDILFSNGCYYKLVRHISGAYELHEVGSGKVFFLYQENRNVEIVGNIYENTDMIK